MRPLPFDVAFHLKDEAAIDAFRRAARSFGDAAFAASAERQIVRARSINALKTAHPGESRDPAFTGAAI